MATAKLTAATEVAERVEALNRFCATLRFEKLPGTVVLEAKNRVLDFLGCAIAGAREPSSQMVIRALRQWGGPAESVVLGTNARMPAALAAFCNGTAGHALEMDDDHKQANLHAGVCVIPAALAMAERAGASGRDVLVAVVAGYEINCRVGIAALPYAMFNRGFHPTGVCGAFGAATAAGRLRGLSFEQFRAALGITGSFASGIFEFVNDGSLVKRLHPGNAAKAGILAVQLAAEGYSGPARVLEGRFGLFSAFAGGCSPEALSRELGQTFEISRCSYKRYACCSFCHALIDAMMELLDAEPIDAGSIEQITGRTFSEAVHLVGEPLEQKQEPKTPVDAQFSAAYALAVAVCERKAMPNQFSWNKLGDARVRNLTRRIRIVGDPGCDAAFPERYSAEVTVQMRDGRVLTHRVPTPKGDPSRPLTQEEIENKFFELAGEAIPAGRARAIRDAVMELDGLGARELVALLVAD